MESWVISIFLQIMNSEKNKVRKIMEKSFIILPELKFNSQHKEPTDVKMKSRAENADVRS